MKNTFSKIRKFMMKNIKYTSLIYLNNTYCMNEKNFNLNNNLNYTYFVNNNNSKFIQKNTYYTNNDNPQVLHFGNNINSNFIQKNRGYINNNNPQVLYFGNNVNSNFIQKNRDYNINSIFTPYYANNNINGYNNAQIMRNIDIKNKIIINEDEEKKNGFLTKKRGRLKKKDKTYCSEDFRKENLINRIFSASLRFIEYKANNLLRNTELNNMEFTKINTFNKASKKYDCIKELFKKKIEEILTKISNKYIFNKNNNENIINKIKQLDGQNDENLLRLKEFLGTEYGSFFNNNISVETLVEYDENFGSFYEFYETDDEHREIIDDYTENFVEKVNSIKTRNKKK